MKKVIRAYKNSKAFKDVLMVYIEDNEPTHTITNNTVTAVYSGDNLIGYNLFTDQFNNYSDGYIKVDQELVNKINNQLSNENIDEIDVDLEKYVVVGKIVELDKIEKTKLTRCQVDIGSKTIQIVCGAQNLVVNNKVAVALPNAVVLGNLIKEGQVNGVDSFGMICSSYELGFSDTKTKGTILILTDNYEVGSKLEEVVYV